MEFCTKDTSNYKKATLLMTNLMVPSVKHCMWTQNFPTITNIQSMLLLAGTLSTASLMVTFFHSQLGNVQWKKRVSSMARTTYDPRNQPWNPMLHCNHKPSIRYESALNRCTISNSCTSQKHHLKTTPKTPG